MKLSSATSPRTALVLGGVVLAVVVAGIGVFALWSERSKTPDYLSGYGGDFTLQSAAGPVSLSDFEGKVVAIYFGYTSCPDACPTTMGMLTAALNQLPPEEQARVRVLLVSFDPARDTPETLADYVKHFHKNIIGVTGTEEQVAAVAKQYGALYERVELPNSALGYSFDHSSVTAVMDVKGNIRSLVRHQDSVDDIIAKLREAMEG